MKKIFALFLLISLSISVTHCSKNSNATCSDGIQNQNETGIDCGGPCLACGTCSDGIQNQNETNIDCGGVCLACETCTDGIQNQGETGIDCGGPCATCPFFYPKTGIFGPNILHDSVSTLQNSSQSSSNKNYYSLAAKLADNNNLKIRLTCTTGVKWYYVVGSGYWIVNNFFPNTQEFNTSGPVNQDLKMFFTGNGSATVEYFENSVSTPTKTKTISW